MNNDPSLELSKLMALWCADAASLSQAQGLAAELGVELLSEADPDDDKVWQILLILSQQGLSLQQTGRKRPGPVMADFVSGAAAHRRLFGGGKGQLIAKACGLKSGLLPRIADVTAGLGRDGFVLATLGCQVSLVERSGVVHALLRDALARARNVEELLPILSRIELHHADGRQWLAELSGAQRPDVVYVDPMFPHTDKSALVKKEMLLFRDIIGADDDASELLAMALDVARGRVVVKRPRKASVIKGRAPSHQMPGKSCRYDIYALRKMEAGS